MTLARKSIYAAAAAVVVAGGRFVLLAILARSLHSHHFGLFVYQQWLVDIAIMACSFGAIGAGSRYFAEYQHNGLKQHAFFRAWMWFALGLPLLAGAVAIVGAIVSDADLTGWQLSLLGFWTVAAGWSAMQVALLTGCQRFGVILAANLSSIAIVILVLAAFPKVRESIELLVGLMAIVTTFSLAFGIPQCLRLLRRDDMSGPHVRWEGVISYSLNMWITGFLWSLVWSRGELPVVRATMGDEGVARYVAPLTLLFGAIQATMLWVSGIAPHLTAEIGAGRMKQAGRLARKMSDIQILVSGFVSIVLIALGPELLRWTFGEEYVGGSPALTVLSMGLFALSASAQNHLLQIETDGRFSRDAAFGGVVVLFVLSGILIPQFGIIGASFARVAAMWCLLGITTFVVRRLIASGMLSTRNILLGALVAGASSIPQHFECSLLATRLGMGVLAIGMLAVVIRSQDDELVVSALIEMLARQLRRNQSPGG